MKQSTPLTHFALLLLPLLFCSCGSGPTEYSLSEFNRIRAKSTAEGKFVIEGTVHGYGVDLRGSSLTFLKSKEGRKYHYIRLTDGKTRSIVWLDSKKVKLPKGKDEVRITGQFVKISDIAPQYTLNKRSVGWVSKVKTVR